MNSAKTKIFFFEDHPLMILGITALINREEDLTLAGSTNNPERLEAEIEQQEPDCLVLDLSLYTKPNLDLIRRLRKKFSQLPITLLSVHKEDDHVQKALKAGANGYVLKVDDPQRLVEAIRANLAGEIYVTDSVTPKASKVRESDSPINQLSRREFRILQLVGKGQTNRQIAETLKLDLKAVENELDEIEKKLGLGDATELLQFAIHWVHHEGGFG